MATQETIDAAEARFEPIEIDEFREQTRAVIPADQLHELLSWLKEDRNFDLLVDVTCVDYLNQRGAKHRFGLAYLVANTETAERLTVRCYLNEPNLTVPTAVDLWAGANWLEREVFDMFGITFAGHPDLRRILMPEEFTAFPLRKDYPLRGRGERETYRVTKREDA